ncbi:MAG: DUF2165 domain-containing protein [Candidatus Acidiferrales bacterium]
MLRAAKIALVFGLAIFYTFVVFNNLTDYESNYQFVHHVLMMDSTFPGNQGMWRAIHSPSAHAAFYDSIIAWEALTLLLCWWGAARMLRAFNAHAIEFDRAKSVAIAALTLSLLMWLIAFLGVGGEWFLMWQSKSWNGQDPAFRMFAVVGIILLLVGQRESRDGE